MSLLNRCSARTQGVVNLSCCVAGLVWLVGGAIGCDKKPEPISASGGDSGSSPWIGGQDGKDTMSGWGPDSQWPGDGAEVADDSDAQVPWDDTGPGGNDSADGDDTIQPPVDGGATDGGGGEPDTHEPVPDTTAPQVVGAFSPDGVSVVVRFSEEMDPGTSGTSSNYSIFGSDNSQLPVVGASSNGVFADLILSNTAVINPALTYTVIVKNVTDLAENKIDPAKNKATIKRSVYLAIVWHQHQPLYHNVLKDELEGPWVRKHATKDYFDMAAIVEDYPDVHFTINLTVVLLNQINIYLERLGDFVDTDANTVDEAGFLAKWKGKTDPWIDLLLEDTPTPETATQSQIERFYDGPWSCVSTNDAVMQRFPEYLELRDKNPKLLTQDDFRKLKIFFELAWFDPDFLDGPVKMPDNTVVDLSDIVKRDASGKYTLKVPPTEDLANRLVAENYKIMANVVGIHKKLMFDPTTKIGQIELTTTPFYHPILPLIYNSDEAKQGQPFDNLPSPPYSYPEDANAHVARAVAFFQDTFGIAPVGMWPGEGSVAQSVNYLFAQNGVRWIATGHKVLEKSSPPNQPTYYPYQVDATPPNGGAKQELTVLFRDTTLSDKVGFAFQPLKGEDAANIFIGDVLAQAPAFGGKDRLVVVILDGENAWEEYKLEHDAKGFFHALYGKLQQSSHIGDIIPVTPTEFIDGNPKRSIPAHPTSSQTKLDKLFAGSWIDGTFSIWIGENEENQAWSCLADARKDLFLSGLPQPNPKAKPPSDKTSAAWYNWKAWDELYAAEGSDWFWWYGADMTTPANDDTPFDKGFRVHLSGMYEFMNLALQKDGKAPMPVKECAPIIQADPQALAGPFVKSPKIDGLFSPNEAEWTEGGAFFYDDDSGGAIKNPNDDIGIVYYGYDATQFYLAISSNESFSDKLGKNYAITAYFSHKHVVDIDQGITQQDPANTQTPEGTALVFNGAGAARELRIQFQGAKATVEWKTANGSGGWTAKPNAVVLGGPVKGGSILEVAIPWADLNLTPATDPLEIQVFAVENGKVIDSAPTVGSKVIFEDLTNLVYVTFEVDVSEKLVPLDKYTSINNPPPPKGKGIVFITGNQDSLQNWTPNKLALLDDGILPDKVKGDQKWTATFGFPPGTLLRYKYTIGLNTDEGKWNGTEEFPLTERGMDVPLDPEIKGVILHDIFADRPMPTGTLGPQTKTEELKN